MKISAAPGAPEPAYGRKVQLLAYSATSSMVVGISSIMPMIPKLAETFAVPHTTASLIITAFTLPGIIFAPLAGVLADRFGRRIVLVTSLLCFCLSGAACTFAPNFTTLIILRFLQGMGAAPLGVLNTTILADVYSGRDVSRYVGYNMAILNVCTALYPTVGGILGDMNWRYAFLLPLLSLPALIVALRTPLANPATESSLRAYLSDAGHVLSDRRILALLAMTGITFTMMYGPLITCVPVLGHHSFGASPGRIGGTMLFSSVGAAVTALFLGRLLGRFGPLRLLLCSQALYVIALIALPEMPGLWWTTGPILLFGIAQGLNIPNVQTQLLEAAPPARRAAVMAVNGMLLRLGQTIGPIIFSSVILWGGIPAGFHAGLALALALSVLALMFIRK